MPRLLGHDQNLWARELELSLIAASKWAQSAQLPFSSVNRVCMCVCVGGGGLPRGWRLASTPPAGRLAVGQQPAHLPGGW